MAYQSTTPTVANSTVNQAPQAFINSSDGTQLGFFALSNHIAEDQFMRVIVALNDPEKQIRLVVKEGKNKNGKSYGIVYNPNNVVLGILSGFTATTLLAIGTGSAVFSDARPVTDVTNILDF